MLVVDAANPGVWGNMLRVEIDHEVADRPPRRFNMRVVRHASAAGNSPVLADRNVPQPVDGPGRHPLRAHRRQRRLRAGAGRRRTRPPTATVRPAANGTSGGDLAALLQANFNTMGGRPLLSPSTDPAAGRHPDSRGLLGWRNGDVQTLSQLRGRLEAAIRAADPAIPLSRAPASRWRIPACACCLAAPAQPSCNRDRRAHRHHRRRGGRMRW